jgi:transposase
MENSKKSLQEEKFILMRSKGMSYSKISDELKVSKPTLMKWGKKLFEEINNQKCLEVDELREEFYRDRVKRIKSISETLKKIELELGKRDFSDVSSDKLVKCFHEESLKLKFEFNMQFKEYEEFGSNLNLYGNISTWNVYQD